MPDGTRLAARLWLPASASTDPVPAIFEYIPYRKTDMVRARDERNHPFFATHGYACLRIDMRGSGDSEGVMPDMYATNELADARHAIEWIASQSWCNGKVGMFGTSWGGTASLQASVNSPSALKAVIAVCATHDRYEDDIHHMGGLLLTDSLEWGATLPTILGAPPTPNVGKDWMDLWESRLEHLTFPLEAWLHEEERGLYWRHGSIIHQAAAIDTPILAVGGWSDRYSNSVMSLVDARPDLVWGVAGPWGHHYPDHGHPRPAIGFQQLALEWWDRWLKPTDRAEPEPPKLRVWLCEHDDPKDVIDHRKGRWVQSGPTLEHTKPDTWHFSEFGLSRTYESGQEWTVPIDFRIGLTSSDTGYFGRFGGNPLDQAEDDARSLTFDTQIFERDYHLYGKTELALLLKTDSAHGQISVRINDLAPDGSSHRVILALRNLSLNDMLDAPGAPMPAARRIRIPFPTKAYRFKRGHRLRVSIAGSYWPMAWPPQSTQEIKIMEGTLTIPAFDGTPSDLVHSLPEALDLPQHKTHTILSAPKIERHAAESASGELTAGWYQPPVRMRFQETGTEFEYETRASHTMSGDEPLSAESTYVHRMTFARPDGTALVECSVTTSSDRGSFNVVARFTAHWNDTEITEKVWNLNVPRKC